MKVLITGSSGSLAKMLIGYLAERNIDIVGIDIRESVNSFSGDKLRFYKCSITEKEKLISIFTEEKPTNVVHFACSLNKIRDRKQEYEIDITGSDNVLKASEITPSVRQLVYTSSAAAYGGKKNNPLWISESEPLDPRNYRYGMNKKLVEHNYTNIEVRHDLKIVVLRPCLVLGPTFDKPKSAVSILIKLPFLPGFTKETKLQFIHSHDLTALMEMILKDDQISGVYNLVPDSYTVVRDIASGKKYIPIPFFLIKGFIWICWQMRIMNIQPASVINSFYPTIVDSSKLISRYGYKFKYSSKEAFEDTVAHNKIPENSWL